MTKWFDSHCHLHLCEAALDDLLGRARGAGVDEMVTIGIEVESSERALEIARANEGVYCTAGVHPNDATDWSDEAAAKIDALLRDEVVVGVGESGLDFYWDYAPHDRQYEAFRVHIELARRHDKALIIHTRESIDAALETLEKVGPPPRLVFHCWSGQSHHAARALELGAHISFAGNVSYKSADNLRDAARMVPAERLLVETDSPFLAPVPHRGKSNEPSFVADVGAAVAAARAEPVDEVASRTTANARALFGLE